MSNLQKITKQAIMPVVNIRRFLSSMFEMLLPG